MDSVSSCLRRRQLCDSVVVPLVILRHLSFIQMEAAQQECGEEDPGEHMYVWSEWGHRSHFPAPTSTPCLALIQVLRAKQRWALKIENSKIPQRSHKPINLSLPWDRAGMDSAYWIFNFLSSFIIHEVYWYCGIEAACWSGHVMFNLGFMCYSRASLMQDYMVFE